MTADRTRPPPGRDRGEALPRAAASPFLRAPEGARAIFLVTLFAVCGPLAGGLVLFGWRAGVVAALAVTSCAVVETLYYRVTRIPALLGRTHAVLTGVLLALTLPAFVPWYVPIVAGAFAIIVGKAVFGGVGHFLWQPALVGRLAVAVLFPTQLTVASETLYRRQPVLAQSHLLRGDVCAGAYAQDTLAWAGQPAPPDAEAFLLTPPTRILRGLTRPREPGFGALAYRRRDLPDARPAALLQLPPVKNLLYGARPGGIGETSVVLLAVAGLYLIYRNYLKWQLPFAMLGAAWLAAAVGPIFLAGPNETVETCWLPLLTREGLGVAFTYISYQLLSGEMLLAVLIVSAEMTSRPITTGGQVLFGAACGAGAMLAQLYLDVPIPCYMAVLAMSTFTPTIDRFWRPRVCGTRHFEILRGN